MQALSWSDFQLPRQHPCPLLSCLLILLSIAGLLGVIQMCQNVPHQGLSLCCSLCMEHSSSRYFPPHLFSTLSEATSSKTVSKITCCPSFSTCCLPLLHCTHYYLTSYLIYIGLFLYCLSNILIHTHIHIHIHYFIYHYIPSTSKSAWHIVEAQ